MPRRRNMELAEQAGQILIAGVEGTSLSAEERAWFHHIRPGASFSSAAISSRPRR